MLERLDGVDWAAVEHAYGPATDVLDLLRALRSPDPATREQVRHELFGTIVHQGTRYAATAAAVPFLAELALAPDTLTGTGWSYCSPTRRSATTRPACPAASSS